MLALKFLIACINDFIFFIYSMFALTKDCMYISSTLQ